MVGHAVTYHNGGAMSAVPDKAPEIDENDWIDQNASRDKMISPGSNDQMPGWNGKMPVGVNSSKS